MQRMENKEEDEKEKGRKGRRILEGEALQAMPCSGSSVALATASVTNKASIVRLLCLLLLLFFLETPHLGLRDVAEPITYLL